MLTVYSFDAKTSAGSWLTADDLAAGRVTGDVVWIDLENPTEDEERLAFEAHYKVHPLTLEDVRRPRRPPEHAAHFPKVEEFPDYLFVVVNPLCTHSAENLTSDDGGGPTHAQLSAVLTHTLLITHHYEPLVAVQRLRDYLGKHCGNVGRGPDYLFHLVLDEMIDEYAPLLDHVDTSLDALEEQVFARKQGNLLAKMLRLKRSIITLRKTLVYEREVLARMSRGEFSLIDEREMVYYRNVYDHLVRFNELIEASREMVMDLMQTHLAAQANKLNEIMKVLAMISTTILPMSLVAGVYGMNFKDEQFWPNLNNPYGFVIAMGLMALSGLGALGLFRWMKWL